MARKLERTLRIEGQLVAETPLHVGGAEAAAHSDMPLAVDGQGRYYLPGTSVAGAIRAHCRAFDEAKPWGFAEGPDKGAASRIIVDDAPTLDTPAVELWHGNGIDRRWGTAADQVNYDREVLPRGTRFAFRLQLEIGDEQDIGARRGLAAWLLDELEHGRIAFGAGATRGLGRVRLENAICDEQDWSSPRGILSWLEQGKATDCRAAWTKALEHFVPPRARAWLELTIHWRPKGPLMSKSARDGVVVDGLPFLSRLANGEFALTLPGAGIKGAWRSHAERIIRTVRGADDKVRSDKHHEQVDVPLAAELFGLARPEERADPEDPKAGKPDAKGSKGLLAFRTCYANFSLPVARWSELERDEDQWRSPPSSARPMTMAMHVAVDRWTGGAADGLLFSAVEPGRLSWEPIRLRVDLSQSPLAELALFWLTLRDFCAGRIPLGYGVNRGYGDLEVDEVILAGLDRLQPETDENKQNELSLKVEDGVIDETPVAELVQRLQSAWAAWIRLQEQEAA